MRGTGSFNGSHTMEGFAVDTELRLAFMKLSPAVAWFDETEIAGERKRDKTIAAEQLRDGRAASVFARTT